MTYTNQKLREALQSISDIDDSTNHAVDASAALDRIGHIAREALALPTAEQVDDINVAESFTSVTKTDAPDIPLSMNQFGRLVELTREHLTDNTFVYKATSKAGDTCHFGVESAAKAWAKGGTVEAIKVREFKLHTSALTAAPVGEREAFEAWLGITPCGAAHDFGWAAWQARAAMSAGDAVDAQRYRWLADCNNYEAGLALIIDPKLTEQALDAAIDAAMRKDKP